MLEDELGVSEGECRRVKYEMALKVFFKSCARAFTFFASRQIPLNALLVSWKPFFFFVLMSVWTIHSKMCACLLPVWWWMGCCCCCWVTSDDVLFLSFSSFFFLFSFPPFQFKKLQRAAGMVVLGNKEPCWVEFFCCCQTYLLKRWLFVDVVDVDDERKGNREQRKGKGNNKQANKQTRRKIPATSQIIMIITIITSLMMSLFSLFFLLFFFLFFVNPFNNNHHQNPKSSNQNRQQTSPNKHTGKQQKPSSSKNQNSLVHWSGGSSLHIKKPPTFSSSRKKKTERKGGNDGLKEHFCVIHLKEGKKERKKVVRKERWQWWWRWQGGDMFFSLLNIHIHLHLHLHHHHQLEEMSHHQWHWCHCFHQVDLRLKVEEKGRRELGFSFDLWQVLLRLIMMCFLWHQTHLFLEDSGHLSQIKENTWNGLEMFWKSLKWMVGIVSLKNRSPQTMEYDYYNFTETLPAKWSWKCFQNMIGSHGCSI